MSNKLQQYNFGTWLKWWLIFLLCILGFIIYYSTGLFWKVHQSDITCICHIITALFFLFSIRVGKESYQACIDVSKGEEEVADSVGESAKHQYRYWYYRMRKYYLSSDMGWFVSNHLPTLGLLGTLIGMAYVFLFSGLDMSTPAGQAAGFRGMGMALYTTIFGTICSLLLKVQLFNLKYFIDKRTGKTDGV